MSMTAESTYPGIRDPQVAARILLRGDTIAFEPGDGYRYGVALVHWANDGAHGFNPDSLIVQGGPLDSMHVLRFDAPNTDWEKWDHHRWERYKHPEQVYNGLIPLLAALGWAGDREPVFDREAVREFE